MQSASAWTLNSESSTRWRIVLTPVEANGTRNLACMHAIRVLCKCVLSFEYGFVKHKIVLNVVQTGPDVGFSSMARKAPRRTTSALQFPWLICLENVLWKKPKRHYVRKAGRQILTIFTR